MSIGLVPVLVAGGGIAYVAAQKTKDAPVPVPVPRQLAPSGGSTITEAQQQTQASSAGIGGGMYVDPAGAPMQVVSGYSVSQGGLSAMLAARNSQTAQVGDLTLQLGSVLSAAALNPPAVVQSAYPGADTIDPELQKKLDYFKAQAQKNFEDMDAVARAEAAEYLNKELKLDPPLTGHEDWDETAARTGKAAGAVVGAAACAATGYGAAVAPICGLVGAYLGEKLGPLLKKTWPEVKEWCENRWGTIEGWADDAYDWFGSVF